MGKKKKGEGFYIGWLAFTDNKPVINDGDYMLYVTKATGRLVAEDVRKVEIKEVK